MPVIIFLAFGNLQSQLYFFMPTCLNFNFFDYPEEGAIVKSVDTHKLMTSAYHFVPGRTLTFEVNYGNRSEVIKWEVRNDMYNKTFLYCTKTKSKAYFVNDDTLHYFTLFEGKRNSLLYYFFIGSYKVLLGYYQGLKVEEQYPLYLLAPSGMRYLHDFTAPFFQYLTAHSEQTTNLLSGKSLL